jgi:phosphoribosylamine--glycine ligase
LAPQKKRLVWKEAKSLPNNSWLNIKFQPLKLVSSTEASDAKDYLKRDMFPVVLKLDGLAGGKGTFLCEDILHTRKLIDQIFRKNKYGSAGNQILIEEMLQGFEVSLMALVSGNTIAPLLPVTDYKRAFDQNQGSNTGGMGAIAPSPWVNPSLLKRIEKEVLVPIVHGMRTEGCPFQGLLYVGLIVSKRGPKVLEFNVRFGDPKLKPSSHSSAPISFHTSMPSLKEL